MLVKQTTKKFYNKWLYKITLRVPGAAVFRLYSLESILDGIDHESKSRLRYFQKAKDNANYISKVIDFLLLWDCAEWTKRIEGDYIDLYTNNKKFYDEVIRLFSTDIKHVFQPDPDNLDALEGNRVILVKKYPKDGFQYRVYILPHALKGLENKARYLGWLNNNTNIDITSSVIHWFLRTDWNWDRRYVLVKDEATLTMMKLRNPDVMGRVYKYQIVG
jgi:hypothetical protein